MSVVAIDLAAKYSAACHMNTGGAVLSQVDSWGRTETHFIDLVTAPWVVQTTPPLAMVVEDLPHGVRYMTVTKTVCRVQGRIVERMTYYGAADAVIFVPPAEWRRSFPGMERGTGPDVVVPVSQRLGYGPPDLSHRILRTGDRATARKVATDYCAAYLIARWAVDTYHRTGAFDTTGTSRYGQTSPRRARTRKGKPTDGERQPTVDGHHPQRGRQEG